MPRLISLALAVTLAGCPSTEPSTSPDGGSPEVAPPSQGVTAAAVVNGVTILERDLVESLKQVADTIGGAGVTVKERARLRDQVLQKMIKDELLVQHARSLGLSISDEEIDQREEDIKAAGGGEEAFARFVDSSGLDPARLRANLGRNLLIERLIARLRAEIVLEDAQLREYYDAHAGDFTSGGSLVVAHLAFGDGAGAQAEAARVRAEIEGGLDFGKAARRYSQDEVSKDNGGLLGEFAPDDLLPVFAQALAKMAPGELSAPISAPDGVHLLRLQARTEPRQAPFDEVRERIHAKLLETALVEKLGQLATSLTQQAHIKLP